MSEDYIEKQIQELKKTCVCWPPLQINRNFDHIYTTYNLGAICPHCKAPFKECKPELHLENLKKEASILSDFSKMQIDLDRTEINKIRFVVSDILIIMIIALFVLFGIISLFKFMLQ